MAIDNLTTTDNESHLSGAYIRTLVKQLASSKPTQHNINHNSVTNDNNNSVIVGEYNPRSIISDNNKGADFAMARPKTQNAPGHKKQVRRRLHTSRPYQERLLNMAEARKEIVTALKFHRASMKQANEKKQQQQQQQQQRQQQPGIDYHHVQGQRSILGHVQDCDLLRPKIESPSTFTNTNVMVENLPYYPSSSYDNHCYNPNNWVISSTSQSLIEPLSQINDALINIPLPNQTLGLNLNLQAFANLDATFCHNIYTSTSNLKYSPSSPMSPSSSSSSTPRDLLGVPGSAEDMMSMHPALDEEEMEKMRSIGEQHQIEWDDTLDLVKSAWWLKVLKSVEFDKGMIKREEGYNGNLHSVEYPFEEFLEFPPWLSSGNNNDQDFLQQHLEDSSSSEGTSLPWVDIGDIDGMDEEWLS